MGTEGSCGRRRTGQRWSGRSQTLWNLPGTVAQDELVREHLLEPPPSDATPFQPSSAFAVPVLFGTVVHVHFPWLPFVPPFLSVFSSQAPSLFPPSTFSLPLFAFEARAPASPAASASPPPSALVSPPPHAPERQAAPGSSAARAAFASLSTSASLPSPPSVASPARPLLLVVLPLPSPLASSDLLTALQM